LRCVGAGGSRVGLPLELELVVVVQPAYGRLIARIAILEAPVLFYNSGAIEDLYFDCIDFFMGLLSYTLLED
jgi:hypothetical protein